ncbi:MAG: serine/threonine protein kinase [gamma proteobacterium symbiont of Bathyaustriella thionipta]|nr:serine/threonine protein kinase [gamma proteobacterium symbiont of Bathyaustriella thionipta]
MKLQISSKQKIILKTPSINYRDDPQYLEGFLHEEWVGKRINNPHVLKILDTPHRRFLYNISEYVAGQSLRQWIQDHPQTHINKAREFLRQIVAGLRAFHRLEMIHLDLKPENLLIDEQGVIKIIDFGSTRVAGSSESNSSLEQIPQGTINYSAPECALAQCSNRSDLFSVGVMAYELLTGQLPYGDSDQIRPANKLNYIPASRYNDKIQAWVDGALRKAVHPNPARRYDTLSEFLHDLEHPNKKLISKHSTPLMERDPLTFWKGLALLLLLTNLVLLSLLLQAGS